MKATVCWLGALFAVAAAASCAQANPYHPCIPQAPDACGPGYYAVNPWGGVYGPNYYLRPYFPPPVPRLSPYASGYPGAMGGGMPGMGGFPGGTPIFPTHPYARSPRDYFMYE